VPQSGDDNVKQSGRERVENERRSSGAVRGRRRCPARGAVGGVVMTLE